MKKLVGALSFVSIGSVSLTVIAQETMLKGQSLVQALRQGGYVMLIRHAPGDKAQKDAQTVIPTDCSTQRNLSTEGRITARKIGQSIDSLQIPFGKVLSSPYCRTMDTGRLAFGRSQASEELGYFPDNEEGKRKAASSLKVLLSSSPAPNTNTVLISHSLNINATVGFVPDEGEVILFKPGSNGKYEMVGRIRPDQWDSLVSSK